MEPIEGESIQVVLSADEGGNGLPAETPSVPPVTETPAVVEEIKEPEVVLYDLPDGRKVDAETLTREWKENFLPDYTKKSQELAKIKSPLPDEGPKNPAADPNWIPQSYGEIVEVAKQALEQDLIAKEEARIAQQKAIEDTVSSQLDEVKKIDPTVNENALFQHATKYRFNDLSLAYQNMKDMNLLVKNVQTTTAKNIAKRNDPVSVSPGATGTRSDPSNFSTARDFLRSLQ